MRLTASVLVWLALALSAQAQDLKSDLFRIGDDTGPRQGLHAEVDAALLPTDRPDVVTLAVKVTLPEGVNTYSQDPGFSKPTKITLAELNGWTPLDEAFTPIPPPKVGFDEVFQQELAKFFNEVTFTRRYLAPEGTDPREGVLSGKIELLLCDQNNCVPRTESFTARDNPDFAVTVAEAAEEPAADPGTEPGLDHAYAIVPNRMQRGEAVSDPLRMQFELHPADAAPGQTVTLAITVDLDENWTTYGIEPAEELQPERPTVIRFETVNLTPRGEIVSVPEPKRKPTDFGDEVLHSNVHEGRVTWRQEFEVEADGPFGLEGNVTYQICEKGKSCLAPNRVPFSLGASQREEHIAEAMPVTESFVTAPVSPGIDEEETLFAVELGAAPSSLWMALVSAFLAGLIMNVMPCVLPVLAIKILSLVQQAGESRARILSLNLVYTLGVMSVFFVVAVISWVLGQSLGAVFQNLAFMTVMACVIFLMGLSLFGVFELPVPGIIPSAHEHQEGYLGAFNTGIIATILGIPCIAPFVVGFFTWTLTQPAPVVFTVFGMMGIGMASPYLTAGIFPALVNWLPKPGMWMVQFKQFTGFVMLGTVIWLLYVIAGISETWLIPTLIIMLALGMCAWMMANLAPPTAPAPRRWQGYAVSVMVSAPVFLFGLWMGSEDDAKLPWQPFSEERLVALREEGQPVLIDFTADWCVICKINESAALNTEKTAAFVRRHNITPLMADFTREDEEIRKWLNRFGQDSVPLTIIIPPGQESEIIALRGQYTQGILLSRLEEAFGESPGAATAESEVPAIEQQSVARSTGKAH